MQTSLAVHGGVLALFLVLVLLLTDPLINHFTTAIPGPPGDNFDFLWRQAWFREAFFDNRLSPFHTDKLYYPFGYSLALGPKALAQVFLSLPLTMMGGHIFSYNTVSLLSFVLAGFGTYLLVLWLTGSRIAGTVGGVIFAFCPARVSALTYGHFNVLGTMWLPYVVLCLELMLYDRRIRWGIAVGIFCTMIIFSCWYNVSLLGTVLAIYFLYRARPWNVHLRSQSFRITLLVFFGILLLSVGVSLVITRPLWQETTRTPTYSLPYIDYISPSLDYFFVPYALRTIFGRPRVSPDVYTFSLPVYVGVLTLILAALGFAVRRDRTARGFMWIGLFSLLLALGPRLRWGGAPVQIPVSAEVQRVFDAGMNILATRLALTPLSSYYALRAPGTIYIPLPALMLKLFVPFLSKMRFWFRFVIVLYLALAALAGMGMAYLQSHVQHILPRLLSVTSKKRSEAVQCVLGLGVAIAVFIEFAILPHHIGYSEVRPQPQDLWLAEQEADFAIAEFPYYKQGGPGPVVYRTLFHGKPSCSGSPPFGPEGHRAALPLLYAFPSPATISLLKRWGVKYVLVGRRDFENWEDVQRDITATPDLRLVAVFDEEVIYHDVGFWNWVPGYDREMVADRIYVYELHSE